MSSSDQNYEQPPQSVQNLYFQSQFLAPRINPIFMIFFFRRIFEWEINFHKWNLLKFLIFNVLCFLKMSPIFVASVHNFGSSDDDIIQWMMKCIFLMDTWFDALLDQKILDGIMSFCWHCLDQHTNKKISRISALASKRGQIIKIMAHYHAN